MRFDPRGELRLLVAAGQVLTRVPLPAVPWSDTTLPRAARYFPLVGLMVAGVSAGIYLAGRHVWSDTIAAIVSVAAALVISGALHEDGLADTADSFGGATPAARLAIMKDSRIGTYGACALVIALALRIAALASLPVAATLPALLAAGAGGRLACVFAMRALPYAGDPTAAKLNHGRDRPGRTTCVVAAVFGLAPFLLLDASRGVPALCLGGFLSALLAWRVGRLLGGYTGDLLGAVEVVFETGALLGAARFVPG